VVRFQTALSGDVERYALGARILFAVLGDFREERCDVDSAPVEQSNVCEPHLDERVVDQLSDATE
jgi:hypothetical protein